MGVFGERSSSILPLCQIGNTRIGVTADYILQCVDYTIFVIIQNKLVEKKEGDEEGNRYGHHSKKNVPERIPAIHKEGAHTI
jgi:hypothetical protein